MTSNPEIIYRQSGQNRVVVLRDRGVDHILGWQSPDDVKRIRMLGERIENDPHVADHPNDILDEAVLWAITRAYRSDIGMSVIGWPQLGRLVRRGPVQGADPSRGRIPDDKITYSITRLAKMGYLRDLTREVWSHGDIPLGDTVDTNVHYYVPLWYATDIGHGGTSLTQIHR